MVRKLGALYSGKALIPQETCDIPEGALVDWVVQGSPLLLPEVTDPLERERTLQRIDEIAEELAVLVRVLAGFIVSHRLGDGGSATVCSTAFATEECLT